MSKYQDRKESTNICSQNKQIEKKNHQENVTISKQKRDQLRMFEMIQIEKKTIQKMSHNPNRVNRYVIGHFAKEG